MAGAFDIGEDKTRVGIVQYSTDTRTEFNLNQYYRRGDLLRAIKNLPYKGGNTMTGMLYSVQCNSIVFVQRHLQYNCLVALYELLIV